MVNVHMALFIYIYYWGKLEWMKLTVPEKSLTVTDANSQGNAGKLKEKNRRMESEEINYKKRRKRRHMRKGK